MSIMAALSAFGVRRSADGQPAAHALETPDGTAWRQAPQWSASWSMDAISWCAAAPVAVQKSTPPVE
jgi:hypothetical protein